MQELSLAQVHALRACSLLVIPPPKEGGPPPGGFPKDLSDLNLSSWASLVQDVASGLMAPPPTLDSEVSCGCSPTRLAREGNRVGVLPLLLPLGLPVYLHGSLPSVMEPGSRGFAGVQSDCLLRGLTTPGMPATGYLLPPPGLPPIDYSKWRLLPPQAPAAGGAPAPLCLPGVGRSAGLWGTAKRIAGSPHPGGLAQRMPVPPMMMPVRQPCPEWPATPYQQVVQPPKKPAGRRVIADTPAGKTVPMGGTMQDHRRPAVRGQGHGSHSISHPRGVPEVASVQPQHQEGGLPSRSMPSGSLPPPPPPLVPERTQPQRRGWTRSALWDPARLAANFRSSGWRKDLKRILKVYYRYSVDYFTEGDWSRVKE